MNTTDSISRMDLNHPCVNVIMAELREAGVLGDGAKDRSIYDAIYKHMEYFDKWKAEMAQIRDEHNKSQAR